MLVASQGKYIVKSTEIVSKEIFNCLVCRANVFWDDGKFKHSFCGEYDKNNSFIRCESDIGKFLQANAILVYLIERGNFTIYSPCSTPMCQNDIEIQFPKDIAISSDFIPTQTDYTISGFEFYPESDDINLEKPIFALSSNSIIDNFSSGSVRLETIKRRECKDCTNEKLNQLKLKLENISNRKRKGDNLESGRNKYLTEIYNDEIIEKELEKMEKDLIEITKNNPGTPESELALLIQHFMGEYL